MFYGVILLGSFIGNSFVIYIIVSNVWMRIGFNYLIMNLVLCDFVMLVFSIFFDYFFEEYNYIWMYGLVMCKFLWLLIIMFFMLVVLIFVVILFDCYCVIMYLFWFCLMKFKIKCIIVVVYVFLLLVVILYLYVFDLKGY